MSPVEWYYARGNRQSGPVASLELKRLAAAGELRPDDLVWREGMAEWTPARNVRGLFEEEKSPASPPPGIESPSKAASGQSVLSDSAIRASQPAAPSAFAPAAPTVPAPSNEPDLFARHPFDALLDVARPHFNAHFIETTARLFRFCGFHGLLPAMVIGAAFFVIVAARVKTDSLGVLLSGVILVVTLATLQFVAGKCCDAIDELNRTTGGNLSSMTLPDCFAALSTLIGVVTLLGAVAAAIQTSMYLGILLGIMAFLVFGYLAVVAMNPAALNVTIGPAAAASDEAIGVLTFLLKALLALAPVAFGAGVIYGTILMGYACYLAMASGNEAMVLGGMAATGARSILIASAALPLAAYLLFLLYSLVSDIWRSILSLRGRSDRGNGEKKSGS